MGIFTDRYGDPHLGRICALIGVLAVGACNRTCVKLNNFDYSTGQRVGVINKVSEKGLFWKTKEGQLSLEGRTSTGEQTGAGVWNFSLDAQTRHRENGDSLYALMEQYMEDGQRVKLTYVQNPFPWPWRAETSYMIQGIEPLELKRGSK